jgi:DNA-binding NtrC family response regulator
MPKETILILDQESHIQWTLKTFLESEQYIVISVNTIERALRNFSAFNVSGLITEYWIDHSRTLKTIREFKKKVPEAYVMMLTNNELPESEFEEIINSGVDDYFIKPLSFHKILLHLRKGLKQHNTFLQKNQLEESPSTHHSWI